MRCIRGGSALETVHLEISPLTAITDGHVKEGKDAIVLAVFAASLRHECIIVNYQTIPLRQVTFANSEHLAKLKEGVDAWNDWREQDGSAARSQLSGPHWPQPE